MDKIGAVCLNEQNTNRECTFEEILLDETLVEGEIWILREALQNVGGINYRLDAKKNYELLIRIAQKYTVSQLDRKRWSEYLSGAGDTEKKSWMLLEPETENDDKNMEAEEGLKTDCYLIGRYKEELLSMGCFDSAVLGIISSGSNNAVQYLEQMVARTKEFYDIYDCTQPILIYVGDDICYSVLDTFGRELGHALEELGQRVEYFDLSLQRIEELAVYVKQRFKAVVGMQTYMFSAKRESGRFVHDEISAPKYHFVFDHPIMIKNHLEQVADQLCVLTPDGNYAKFIKEFYRHSARFLPPAGVEKFYGNRQRDYGIVFLGSYGDGLAEVLWNIKKIDRRRCCLLNRFILYMRKNLNETPEHALEMAMEHYGISCTKKEFIEMLYRERDVIFRIANYYRNKTIKTLLEAGIVLHVFGDSWKRSPMFGHSALIFHEAVTGRDALEVYARSKLSLNIMTWHKDGFTERIANAMLQKSVVITDRTNYLEKNFVNGEELLMFDLGHLEELPKKIKNLLNDDKKREQMAENGRQKALAQHTWKHRASKILEFIEEDRI